jgi:hypothetical protein
VRRWLILAVSVPLHLVPHRYHDALSPDIMAHSLSARQRSPNEQRSAFARFTSNGRADSTPGWRGLWMSYKSSDETGMRRPSGRIAGVDWGYQVGMH